MIVDSVRLSAFFFAILLFQDVNANFLRIGAFNVQVFGRTKVSQENIVGTLSQIIRRYDIIFVQEIRDSSETAIYSLLNVVNSETEHGIKYGIILSDRLGRSVSKEQYAFLYKLDVIQAPVIYQFEDSADAFEREPFGMFVNPKQSDFPSFFLIGIHIKPSKVVEELNYIDDVFDDAANFFSSDNGVIVGDFNAGCSYLSYPEYMSLDLVTDSRFTWLIDIHEDTTTTDSDCAYDRIVVSGNIRNYIPNKSVGVFKFDVEYGLTWKESQEVSDHFPIEFEVGSTYINEKWNPMDFKCELGESNPTLRVGAFNIQVFGVTKFKNLDVVRILSKIVQHYDILLIQEIRDSTEKIIYSFLDFVNRDSVNSIKYTMAVSDRLGRSSSKEQYAFFFREDKVQLLSLYQEEDVDDVFEREPFCILFKSIKIDIPDFFLVGIHVKPSDAVGEINYLDDVFERASTQFGTTNGIILGDLNADCSYLTAREHRSLDLVMDTRFSWLIDRKQDTTTTHSLCSYDRIIVGGNILKYIPSWSAKVFNFDVELGLSNEQAQGVSDHYPVEFQMLTGDQVQYCEDQQSVLLKEHQIQKRDEL